MPMTHEQIRLACEVGRIGTWILDLDTGHVEFQGDTNILRGVPRDSMDERYATIHPDDGAVMKSKLASIDEQHPDYDMEYRAIVPGQPDWHWFHVKGKLCPGTRLLYGVGLDVTEQKSREEFYRHQLATILAFRNSLRELTDNLKTS